MLIDNIMKSYRDFTGRVELAQPVVTVPAILPAANAGSLAKAEMQARRLRRQRRMERTGGRGFTGWTVRTW
ncbi:MAG: hypothetical protein HKP03_06730 [Xanthomonadales bacterium]|nr:hypothetical protein [Gammaproteobacteria bacterium]NNK38159.1 hypothetical protein [Xanthomonadales bacterium]